MPDLSQNGRSGVVPELDLFLSYWCIKWLRLNVEVFLGLVDHLGASVGLREIFGFFILVCLKARVRLKTWYT